MAEQDERNQVQVVPDGGDPPFPQVIPGPEDVDPGLGRKVASGAKWSMLGNMVTRAGSMLTGIAVANLLDPSRMGIFAVALTVGQMLLVLIDMGLGTDLVRGTEEELERKAPTVATLGLVFCSVGALFLLLGAPLIASALKAPDAIPLLRVYAGMVFIGGFATVPQGVLTRRLDQRSLMFATLANFFLSNGITLALLLTTSLGVVSLPIGAVIGMAAEVSLFYVFAKRRIHLGWNRSLVRGALGFGAPVAGANVMQVLQGSVDRLVISPVLGGHKLGFYTMAANISNWPVSVFGLVVRSVAMPAFAQSERKPRDPILTLGAQLTWLISFPAGLMLALFAHDVIFFVYGPKYAGSVTLLTSLGIYGAIRVLFDTLTGFLYARNNSRAVLQSNVVWLTMLLLCTWFGARYYGTEGAALAQVLVCVVVAMPLFLRAVHRSGASIPDILRALMPATLACVPAGGIGYLLTRLVDAQQLTGNVRLDAMIGLAVGGLSFLAIYVPLVFRRVRASVRAMRHPDDVGAPAPLPA